MYIAIQSTIAVDFTLYKIKLLLIGQIDVYFYLSIKLLLGTRIWYLYIHRQHRFHQHILPQQNFNTVNTTRTSGKWLNLP